MKAYPWFLLIALLTMPVGVAATSSYRDNSYHDNSYHDNSHHDGSDDDRGHRRQIELIRENFPTSLHKTRFGHKFFYDKALGGFGGLTGVHIEELGCQGCHGSTYADGTTVDSENYEPSCKDCHNGKPGEVPVDDGPTGVCLGCHSRQQAEINLAQLPDVHRDRNFRCMTCHTKREMHGDGIPYPSMLAPGAMDARCENCHKPEWSDSSARYDSASSPFMRAYHHNRYHDIHIGKLDCSTCHMKTALACNNCHLPQTERPWPRNSFVQIAPVDYFTGNQDPDGDFRLLVRRPDRGDKVFPATYMTTTYEGEGGKAFYVIAPNHTHSIVGSNADGIPSCVDCHGKDRRGNHALQDLEKTGEIPVLTCQTVSGQECSSSNDEFVTLKARNGVIPVSWDWREALRFAFAKSYECDTDPPLPFCNGQWTFLTDQADGKQMLFARPLTRSQLRNLHGIPGHDWHEYR